MKTRLYNARILTMADDQKIFNGEIVINDDKIEYVGPEREDSLEYDINKDCKGNLLMPGFKNAHTHSGMSVLRSLADDLPLSDWLNNAIFPVEAKMRAEDIYYFTQLSVLEYLTSGITACFDMYLTPESIANAMDDCGFRCVQVGGANDFSQSSELLEKWYNTLNQKDSLQSFMLGFHAEYTNSIENLKSYSALAQKYKAPVYTHLGETKAEVEGCIERYKMPPLKFLDSLGMFDYGGGIYHGVYVTDEEMDIMKEKNIFVVTNPASNAKLASGIAPIKKYLDKGIPVAIGTDGPASNNCLDMFREMFLVTGLGKIVNEDASSIDAFEVLKMACVNGAHAMNLNDCDTLKAGKKADIIMIDLNMPNMQPINNIAKNIVYSGSKINVKMTMINGKVLYENNEFKLDIDPDKLYAKVDSIKKRIIG